MNDTSWQESTNISTSIAFSHRTANTFYARSNGTLLSITNSTQGYPETVSPADLFYVLNRFFASTEADTTTQDLIRWVTTYLSSYLTTPSPTELLAAVNFLRELLTVPLLWFQANDLNGALVATSVDVPTPGLPFDLYVTAGFARSERRIVIAQWTMIVFASVGVAVYAWCISFLCWAMRVDIQGPKVGSYPLLNFASRITTGMLDRSLAEVDKSGGMYVAHS